mmetsp:Transcript_43044/g.121708  ORF Transcript_43044/g.121708 Transcript_43044/m.121708 type:complete len:231 (-) Transcript_43044:212-904(-)
MSSLRVPAGLRVADPDLPRLVPAEGVARAHGDYRDLVLLGLYRPGHGPCHVRQVAINVVDGVLLGGVQVECGQSQGLAIWLVDELVPIHHENHQHAGLDADLGLVAGPGLGQKGEGGRAWASVEDHHQLRSPQHCQISRRILVLELRRRIGILVALEGHREHGCRAAVEVESEFPLDEGPQDGADRGDGLFRHSERGVLDGVGRVRDIHVERKGLTGALLAQVTGLELGC